MPEVDDWVTPEAAAPPPAPVDDWITPPKDDWITHKPEAEGMLGTFAREFGHAAPGAVVGAGAGLAGGAIGGSTIGGLPGTLIGGALGGIAGGVLGETLSEAAQKAVGFDDVAQRKANEEANPWMSAGGRAAAVVLGFGAGATSTAARVGSAAIGGGFETGRQLVQEGKISSLPDIATQTAAGAIFAKPYGWGEKLERQGAALGARMAPEGPWIGRPAPAPPAEPIRPAAEGPAQGEFPWGAERQPELPLQPLPANEPPIGQPGGREGQPWQPELPLEPPPKLNPSTGQYEAPFPEPVHQRELPLEGGAGPPPEPHGPAGPQSAPGVSESPLAPPKDADVGLRPDNKPVQGEREGYGKDVRPKTDDGSSQTHGGTVDPDLQHAIDIRQGEMFPPEPAPAPAPPTQYGPQLDQQFPQMPGAAAMARPLEPPQRTGVPSGAQQGVLPEPQRPPGTTRVYSAEGGPRGTFFETPEEAGRIGPVRYTDVKTSDLGQFRRGGPGELTTNNPVHARNSQPLAPVPVEPVKPTTRVEQAPPGVDAEVAKALGPEPPNQKFGPEGSADKPGTEQAGVAPAKTAEPPPVAEPPQGMDFGTANKIINQPGFRMKEAKARGVTPEVLLAEAKGVKPPVAEPPRAETATAEQKAAYEAEVAAQVAKAKEMGSRDTPVAEPPQVKETPPAPESRPPADYTGKVREDISASEYSQRMSDLRANKPRPVEKLWRDPSKAPPEQVAAAREALKAWDREYRAVSKNQKAALERDNAIFKAKQEGREPTAAELWNAGTPKEITVRNVGRDGLPEKVKVKDETTVRDALEKWGTREGLMGQLTPFIRKMVVNTIGDLPVYIIPKSELARHSRSTADNTMGLYNRQQNHIVINEAFMGNARDMAHTIIHEAVHGVTSHALLHDDATRGIVNRVMVDVANGLVAKAKTGISQPMNELRYGFKNEREFIAEAFSNPQFQKMLSEHELSPVVAKAFQNFTGTRNPIKSAWDGIVETVRKVLGVPPGKINALEAAMRATEHSMSINDAYKKDYMRRSGTKVDSLESITDSVAARPPEEPAPYRVIPDGQGGRNVMQGEKVIQNFPNLGEAYKALNSFKAADAAEAARVAAGGAPKAVEAPTREVRAAGQKDLEEGVWPTIQRFFMPGSRSESGRAATTAYMEGHGTTEQTKQQARARLTNEIYKADTAYEKMSPLEQRKLDNYTEGGSHIQTKGHELHDPTYRPPEAMAKVLEATKKGYEDFKAALQSLPQHEQSEFIKDFIPHMYGNTPEAKKFASDWIGSPSGSVKQRVFPTQEDAIAAGLTPKAISPVDRFIRYSESISKYISDKKTLNALNEQGWLHWTRPQTVGASGSPEPLVRGAPPPGFMALKMPGAVDRLGRQAYAPRDMAETLNNLYDAGLRRNETAKNMYDFALQTKNMWTAAELGMSPYHAFTMVGETFGSNYSRAISELASGRADLAGKTFARSFVSPVVDYKYGKRMIDVYLGKAKDVTPQEQTITDALKKAGIKPIGLEHVQDAEHIGKMASYATSWARGTLGKEFRAAGKEIFGGNWKEGMMFVPNQVARVMQTAMQPLFQHYIPAMKTAMASRDMASYLTINPHATPEELAAVGRKTLNSMDNRFGEMDKDSLSMNKAFKDAAFVAMRSFAFTIGGPIREVAGGARSGIEGAIKGENRLSMGSKAYDPRVGYALAFPLVTMGMASIVQYAMTGKWPSDWKDVVVPKTGGKVQSGKSEVEERMLLPGYHKDFLGYAFHPTQELMAKMAGPWQALQEQITGKDWKGQKFVPPGASLPESLKYRGQALLEKATPLAFQSMQEKNAPKIGSNIPKAARMAGFREAGSYLENPNYGQQADKREQKDWQTREKQINRDRAGRGLQPLPTRELPLR